MEAGDAAGAKRQLSDNSVLLLALLAPTAAGMAALDAVEVAVTLAGAGLGLWWGGVPGAVIGSTVTPALVAPGDWLYLRRRFGLQAPFWRYAKVIVAALGMAAALHGLTRLGLQTGPGAWPLLFAAGLGALVYTVLLMLLFPRETGSTMTWVKAKAAGT
jgi:hypothetical protein